MGVRKKLVDHANKMISAGLTCLVLLAVLSFDPQLLGQINKHDDTIKLMLAYLRYFWCSTLGIPENTAGYDIAQLAYHNNFQCQSSVDAANMTRFIVQKKAIMTIPTYHKLLWIDKVHDDAAAATALVIDGSYLHHDHIAAIVPMPTYHMPFWKDEERAVTTTAGVLSHRASYKSHEHTNDAGDNGVPRTKIFET